MVKRSVVLFLGLYICLNAVIGSAETAVGVLSSKDHSLIVYTGTNGPLFTVKDREGTIVAERIDADTLAQQFPKLSEMTRGVADDASLTRPERSHYGAFEENK